MVESTLWNWQPTPGKVSFENLGNEVEVGSGSLKKSLFDFTVFFKQGKITKGQMTDDS